MLDVDVLGNVDAALVAILGSAGAGPSPSSPSRRWSPPRLAVPRGRRGFSAYDWLETRVSRRRLSPPVLRPPLLRDRSEPSAGSPYEVHRRDKGQS